LGRGACVSVGARGVRVSWGAGRACQLGRGACVSVGARGVRVTQLSWALLSPGRQPLVRSSSLSAAKRSPRKSMEIRCEKCESPAMPWSIVNIDSQS
jgi:hypothetical protein